jgi:FO synthase
MISREEACSLPARDLIEAASRVRDETLGPIVTYSKKVFLPLTHLCRDVCAYCTFAEAPGSGAAYMSRDEVIDQARKAAALGCKEALFTLGDKPELRYPLARDSLAVLGHETTLSYLAEIAALVFRESGLLPHLNPGLLSRQDFERLRPVSVSMGLMLESASDRLLDRGGPHHACPDKVPRARIETIALAGEMRVPFTTGLLIGIGETRAERVDALIAIRDLHRRFDHVQEVIIQPFRAKPGTRMAGALEPSLEELEWTIAVARLLLGVDSSIQTPPNLSPGGLARLIRAGIDDWGGLSPLTPDFVNPEAPWPQIESLRRATEEAGKELVERLAIYPRYALAPDRWLDPRMADAVTRAVDSDGYARTDTWSAGAATDPPAPASRSKRESHPIIARIVKRAMDGEDLTEHDLIRLFRARGADEEHILRSADDLRRSISGDDVTYVVNRNINYTNICTLACGFCAFSKGRLLGRSYRLELDEIARRTEEAFARGATEVCLQGGIHPDYTGRTYVDICRAVKEAAPKIHVHAFSPLEIHQGARTLGVAIGDLLERLMTAGLGTLPGTAAEILDDEVRARICPDKITTREWLEVMQTAHGLGLRSTATIMFGHVEGPLHWARHLLRVRELQKTTRGFTELVPLPFVHMEAPIFARGGARPGPTFREAVLMHATARLALHPHIANIQTSWVKMGPKGAIACLRAGANDLGGTLMNESITRAAGAIHGQELPPSSMQALAAASGLERRARQRTTGYARA